MTILNDRLRKLLTNKWFIRLTVVLFLFLLLYLFRIPILRGLGNHLVDTDEPQQVEAIMVLGGNSKDRGAEAARLYQKGFADHFVCTGGNVPGVLEVIDTVLYEAQITQIWMEHEGIPSSKIELLLEGTSTWEEAEALERLCKEKGWKKVMILSSMFHMNRVRFVFEDRFEAAGIEVLFCGAPSSRYDEKVWWQSEEGLLMVNNEYVKLIYYWLKY